MPPEICPQCGAVVPPRAKACPDCGADESTGWSDSATADRLGIPDDNFDYQHFVREEFGPARGRTRKLSWLWGLTALLLIGLLLWFYFR